MTKFEIRNYELGWVLCCFDATFNSI